MKPTPHLLTRAQLAEQIRPRVTIRAVAKWRLLGLPSAGKIKNRPAFDLAECQAWVKANVQRVHGGNHGGPKKGRRKDAPARSLGENLSKQLVGMQTSGDVMERMGRGKLSHVGAHTLSQAVKAAQAMDDLHVSSGKLVVAEEVKEEWASQLQIVRTMLDGLAARITRAVVAETPLERETETAMRNAIAAEVVRVLGDLERGKA